MHPIDLNYRALLEVTNVLNSQRDTDSLWRAIAGQIKQVVPWERAGITLYCPESDSFHFYAVETSLPARVLQRDAVIPRVGSAVGWVYKNHRVHIRPDLKVERPFSEDDSYWKEGLGRMINLPLLTGERCLGTLNIGSIQSGEPDHDDVEFLCQVATQIAYAIAHVQAYEEIDLLRRQLAHQNAYLVEEIKLTHNFGPIVGESHALRKTLSQAKAVGPTSTTVLITGETGTGKELLARAIHELSPRRNKPFIRVNCAAIPTGLVESELFGHERGAFTGADQRRIGRFELADGGTLFLDEIGELPVEVQVKLLHVLENEEIDRVGGTHSVPVDVRIVAATNIDLLSAIEEGRFRSDLYHRLRVFPLVLPPLRERPDDIPLIARHFLERCRVKLKRPLLELSESTIKRLLRYSWPGNVRELQNVIERGVILSSSSVVDIDDQFLIPSAFMTHVPPPSNLQDVEREHIKCVLEQTQGRIYGPYGAATRLGLNPSTLRSRMKKLGISRTAGFNLQPPMHSSGNA